MGFEIGIADHVVKGEGARADDVAKVCVRHATFGAAFKPPCHERNHGMRFATVPGETTNEIRAFARLGAVPSDKSGNWATVERRDEYLDVLWMCSDVPFGKIEEGIVERSRNL